MDFLHQLFSSDGLRQLITNGGVPVLCLIIFAETGLLIGFFLPGDTLLISAGLLSATNTIQMSFLLMNIALMASAIIGNTVGYYIGKTAGKKLFERPDSKLFKREHLIRTHAFYEKHGGKTMVLARFVPIVRTFAPVVAGVAEMDRKKFFLYNVAGAVLWIGIMTSAGYYLAKTFPEVEKYLPMAILAVVGSSLLLPIVHFIREKRKK
ncbi:MAG TPA: VTT domain-containing protein [Candidatus Kapabacteria bacterium]|nr:VTT domain-containing protein [Candidatus Kapabacteria bacterium]